MTKHEPISDEVMVKHCKVMLLLLNQLAKQKGISDQAIADRIGFKRQNVNRMLNAENEYLPTLKNFLKVAHAIGVRFLFEDKDGVVDLAKAFNEAFDEMEAKET